MAPVITINSQYGAGGSDLGADAAKQLGADYVDRLILAEASKKIGATVEALADREERSLALHERLARFIQNVLERSAVAGAGGDPYFGPGLGPLLGRDYIEAAREPITKAQELDDKRFMEVTREVVLDLARTGNVVIIGRGSNLILGDAPGVFHVGVIAPWDVRVPWVMARHNMTKEVATRYLTERSKGRVDFFKKFFKVHPDDPVNYHMMVNTGLLKPADATAIIVQAALCRQR